MAMAQAPGAIDLGPYDIGPWDLTSFTDTAARWIWSRAGANTLAPTGLYTICFKTLVLGSPTTSTLHVVVDDMAVLSVNGNEMMVLEGG